MTLIWLPLIPLMVKWVKFVIRGDDKNETAVGKPLYLDEKIISQPVPALYLVSEEVRSSTQKIGNILQAMRAGLTDPVVFSQVPQGDNAADRDTKGRKHKKKRKKSGAGTKSAGKNSAVRRETN